MRLVTWNLGHRRNGNRRPDRFVAALNALEPDIAVLVDRTPGDASSELLAALANIGLRHQLRGEPDTRGAQVLLCSRLEMVPGSLGTDSAGAMPTDALHAYLPTGLLDVVSLPRCRHDSEPASHATCWNWLLEATATLKQRRSIVFGDLQDDPTDTDSGSSHPVRHFIRQGWQIPEPVAAAHRRALRDGRGGIPARRLEGLAVGAAGTRRRPAVATLAAQARTNRATPGRIP